MAISKLAFSDWSGGAAQPWWRKTLWTGLLAVALAVTTSGTAGVASACTCARRTLCQLVQAADVVFEATRLSKNPPGGKATYTAVVGKIYKGTVQPNIIVESKGSFGTCGVSFQPDTPYIVFGKYAFPGTVTTNTCSGTAPKTQFTAAAFQQITQCATIAGSSSRQGLVSGSPKHGLRRTAIDTSAGKAGPHRRPRPPATLRNYSSGPRRLEERMSAACRDRRKHQAPLFAQFAPVL